MLNFSHNVQESGLYTYLYSRNPSLTCSSRSLQVITEKDSQALKSHYIHCNNLS